jgi:hypothetical protein
MSKNFQEPEEKDLDSNIEILDDFNPLDEAVNEKDYTRHNVKINPNDFNNPIPEPSFMPPPMSGGLTNEEKQKKPQEPFNPKMNEMPKKDRHDSAEKVAEMIMTGYKWVNNFADKQLQFDEAKLMKMQSEGEIDLSVEIPLNPTTIISGAEFIQEYNEQSKGTIVVTKEFEDEIMPVLTRVLEKRGIGMNDEQYLLYLGGKDLAIKGFMVSQQMKVKKDILNTLKETLNTIKGNGFSAPPPQPTYTQPTYTPQQEAPQQYSQPLNTDINVNDFVNVMTGATPTPQPQEEYYEEPMNDYTEPKPQVKVISEGTKKPLGKRGRPSKKK